MHALPKHVAVIMDGNGRWAKEKGQPRVFGHRNGVKALRATSEAATELGIQFVTLYAFSTENWNRPAFEVNALMALLVDTVKSEIKTLQKNNIRLLSIGDIDHLPSASSKALKSAIKDTENNTGLSLVLALNYSSKWELVQAVKAIAQDVKEGIIQPESIDENLITSKLNTFGMPDPELLIRTSGEHRLSNFLLWQLAYAEFYFTETLWPDFSKEEFYKAILSYQNRERRFGMTSEQLT